MLPFFQQSLAAVDASANQNGPWIEASHKMNLSAFAVMTGASTGTLNIQASNDPNPPVDSSGNPNPQNFINIPTQTVTIGAAGAFLIPSFSVSYKWIRASYVKNNGSAGTITVNLAGNGF